jgi:toxin ParE1/3/4
MSAPKRNIIIAPDARSDLRGILAYTQIHWGHDQRLKYRVKIYNEFDQLANFPFKGRARDEISEGLRSVPIDQHLVYYRVGETSITIHRIVHSKSDISDEHGLTRD